MTKRAQLVGCWLTLAAVFAACGHPDDESGAVVQSTRQLTGLENLVTVNPDGFAGSICVGSLGCLANQPKEYPLLDGTYSIDFSYVPSLVPGPTPTITVSNQGTQVVLSAEALKYFQPPVSTGTRATTITARTVTVKLDKGGFPGFLDLWTSGTFATGQAKLVPSRIHYLYTAYAAPLPGNDWRLPFAVHPDGRVTVTDPYTRGVVIEGTGSQSDTLLAQTATVRLDKGAYVGHLDHYAGGFVNNEAKLLKARIHYLYTNFAHPFPGEDWRLPFTVHADGRLAVEDPVARRTVVEGTSAQANTLIAQLAPITMIRSGWREEFQVYAATNDFPLDQPESTGYVLRGRRYSFYLKYSWAIPHNNVSVSTDGIDFSVNADGSIVLNPEIDGRNFTVTASGKIQVLPVPVTLDNAGYRGFFSLLGSSWSSTQGDKVGFLLLRSRRYAIALPTLPFDTTEGPVYGGVGGAFFVVNADGSVAPHGKQALDSLEAVVETNPSLKTAIRARTRTFYYQSGGHPDPLYLHDSGTLTAEGTTFMVGRRYRLRAYNSVSISGDTFFSPEVDFAIDPNGAVSLTGGAAQSLTVSGSTISAKLASLTLNRGGYTGSLYIAGQTPNQTGAAPVNLMALVGRRYRVIPPDTQVTVNTDNTCTPSTLTPTTVTVSCSAPTAPAAPSNAQAQLLSWAGTIGAVQVTWTDNSINEGEFAVERSADGGAWGEIGRAPANSGGPASGYVDWVPEGSYSYRVRALNGAGSSAYSAPASVLVQTLFPPELTAALMTQGRVDLSWSAITGATSATLYRGVDGQFQVIATPAASATTFSDATVVAGKTYSYRLDVTNALGMVSSNVATVTTAIPVAPTGVYATVPATNQVTVNWSHTPSSETGFLVQLSTNGGSSYSTVQTVAASARSWTHGSRASGSTYRYRVVATNAFGNGPPSDPTVVTMATPPAPTTAVARIAHTNRVDFTWVDNSTNENGFIVERSTNGAAYGALTTTAPNVVAFSDLTVATGAQYQYRVRATNAFGASTNATSAAVPLTTPNAPTNLSASIVTPTRIDLTWTESATNATQYRVERAEGSFGFRPFSQLVPGVATVSDTTVMVGVVYTYRVSSENVFGPSPGVTITVPMAAPPPPTAFAGTTISGSQINLSWAYNDSGFQTRFRLDRRPASSSTFTTITNPTKSTRTYNDTGLAANTTYIYQLYAENGLGLSVPVELTTATSVPAAPTNLVAKVMTGTRVDLEWTDASVNETGFRVQSSTNGTSFNTIPATSSPPLPAGTRTYSFTATSNTGYWFRVFALNGAGQSLNSNTVQTHTSLPNPAPTGLTATALSSSQIRLLWNETTTNETGFRIERAPAVTGPWNQVGEVGQNIREFNDSNLQPSTSYSYRVIAYNGLGVSSTYSGTATATTSALGTGTCTGHAACSASPPAAPPAAAEPAVGAVFNGLLKGELSVSPTGAATYTVPIAIPPGVAGMAPNLSLVYSSQGGNGLAGQGWELGGLSMIHRCARTKNQDGLALPVDFQSSKDGLCLDGQRLIDDGKGGYFLEMEQFSTIRRIDDGSIPSQMPIAGFEVVTKSGEVRTYGLRDNARVAYTTGPPTSNVVSETSLVWMLSKVTDAWGNYFELHYNNDEGAQPGATSFLEDGVRVTSIDYTGFMGTSADGPTPAEPEQFPFWRVTFGYESRQDVRTGRISSITFPKKHRLKNIKIVSPASPQTPVGAYTLTYLPDDPTRMLPSRLRSIGYCAGEGSAPCLKPLEFDWQGGGYGWRSDFRYKLPDGIHRRSPGRSWGSQLIDLDGDGLVDFVIARPEKMEVKRNGWNGFEAAPPNWTLPIPIVVNKPRVNPTTPDTTDEGVPYHALFADMNNDGLLDLVGPPASGGQAPRVWINRLRFGEGWVPTSIPVPNGINWGNIDFTDPKTYTMLDMNGDGRADLVKFGNPNLPWVDVYWNKPTGWENSKNATVPISYDFEGAGPGLLNYATCPLRDVNRDGLPDAVCERSVALNVGPAGLNGSAWKVVSGFQNSPFALVPPEAQLRGDVDGDGMHDVVTVHPYSTSGCTYTEPKPRTVSVSTGRAYGDAPAAYLAALNTFLPPATIPAAGIVCADYYNRRNHLVAMADFNADGLVDMVVNHDVGVATSEANPRGQLLVNTGAGWVDYDGGTARIEGNPTTPIPAVPADAEKEGYPGDTSRAAVYIDINGDGVTDVAQTRMVGNQLVSETWTNEFSPPTIKLFPNGLARKTEVTYRSLTQQPGFGLYADDKPLDSSVTYLMLPLRVVSSILAEDGRGQGFPSNTSYEYRNLRGSSTGRGPQGFGEIRVRDEASGTRTRTFYAQAHPYTGRVVGVIKEKNGFTLTTTATAYCDSIAEGAAEPQCTPETGPPGGAEYPRPTAPVFVYPKAVLDVAYSWPSPANVNATPTIVSTTTDFRYDKRGNPIRTQVTMRSTANTEVHEKIIANAYGAPNSSEERLGRVTRSVVTTQRTAPLDGNNALITHTTEFEYDGLYRGVRYQGALAYPMPLKKKKIEPGAGAPFEQHTAYAYDARGNATITTECQDQFSACTPGAQNPGGSTNPPFRTSRVSYDPSEFNAPAGSGLIAAPFYTDKGRFPVKVTNALGQSRFVAYAPVHGGLIQETEIDGLHTCHSYDAFGRKNAEVQRCGTAGALVTTTNQYLAPTGVTDAALITVARPPSGADSWTYTDALGRTVRTRTRGFSSDIVETGAKTYDIEGRVKTESKPRIEGQGSFKTTFLYDSLGRVELASQELGPIGFSESQHTDSVFHSYDKLTVTTQHVVGSESQTRSETKNVVGQVVSVKDSNGVEIKYTYDADGNLTDTTDPAQNKIHIEYDIRGRKKLSRDPDMGEWTFGYNGFGDLVSQTDAKGQTVTTTHDVLGRMTSKTDAGGTATWVYDVAPGAGIGKLAAMAGAPDPRFAADCTIPSIPGTGRRAGRSFKYTASGQVEESAECVDGATFLTDFEYDGAGRQSRVTYPEVRGSRLSVRHHYTSTGFLHYLTDTADNQIYWAAKAVNAFGQVTEEYTRNGVVTVANRTGGTGWLKSSTTTSYADGGRVIQQLNNTFDEVGNLRTRSRLDQLGTPTSVETLTYDTLNRLKTAQVQHVGGAYNATESFNYDQLGNLTLKSSATYTYTGCLAGNRPAGPHAVCTVGGSPFQYDLNGNMVSGGGRTVDYNVENKASRITQASTTVDFSYGADGNRVVQAVGGAAPSRTLYVGLGATGKSLYERTTRGTTTEHVQFLYAGSAHSGNAFALRVTTEDGATSPAPAMKYNAFDHLGSVTATTDAQGKAVGATGGSWANSDLAGYDPWGGRRNPDGRPADPASFQLKPGRRGFTGHEAISGVGLVNMNGRIYDPAIGRFLSPDPAIQFAANLQSYNRYSYVLNNPLSYTDPTGYYTWGGVAQIGVGVAIAVVGTWACAASYGTACYAGWAFVATWFSTTSAVLQGASTESIVIGGLVTFAAAYAGGVVGNGVVEAIGKGWWQQMLGGAVSGAVSSAITTVTIGDRDQLGWNILIGAALGALTAVANYGITSALSAASAGDTHHIEIDVSREGETLAVFEANADGSRGRRIFEADIVCGCDGSQTPIGRYKAGAWIADKTNAVHGPIPWSKDSWGNPYGPHFLELRNTKSGAYTRYGIHGTRGPRFGGFEKPPVPEFVLKAFIGPEAKYLYCSHGCIRMSNQAITDLRGLLTSDAYRRVPVFVNVQK